MKARWKLALLLCSVAVAASAAEGFQPLDELLPKCALPCLQGAIANSTCSPTDTTCTCNDEAIQLAVSSCVLRSCTVKDRLMTLNLTSRSCGEPIRDRALEHIILSDVIGGIAFIFIAQRLISKILWDFGFGLDDWFMLISALSGVPSLAVNQFGVVAHGLGRDIWNVPFNSITEFGKFFLIMEVLYFLQVMLLKMSLLFFYYRIFPAKGIRRVILGTIAFNGAFGFTFVVLAIFQCRPVSYFWKKWDEEHHGSCHDINAITWSNAAISIALDLCMLTIPFSQLRKLQMNQRKKIGVGIMFLVGTFITVVSVVRLQFLVRYGNSVNQTWDYLEVNRWSLIEISVGQICACMPSARVALSHLIPGIFDSAQRSRSRSGSYTKHGSGKSGDLENSQRSNAALTDPARAHKLVYETRVNPVDQVGYVDPVGITIDRTYAVDYGETDEVQLVNMKEADHKSYISTGTTGTM